MDSQGEIDRDELQKVLEDLRDNVQELRTRENIHHKLTEALAGAQADRAWLESQVTQLRERLLEHEVPLPKDSWKPPRIERLEHAAREVERLKYGISNALHTARSHTGEAEAWLDAQAVLDQMIDALEGLLQGSPAGPR